MLGDHALTNHSQGRPQHIITNFMHQAHKQLSQAAQLSLKISAHLTFNITLACSALHCSIANIDGFGATQSILQMSKTTWIFNCSTGSRGSHHTTNKLTFYKGKHPKHSNCHTLRYKVVPWHGSIFSYAPNPWTRNISSAHFKVRTSTVFN